jgi:hypothetical protein
MVNQKLAEEVGQMKAMAEKLLSLTFPAATLNDEEDTLFLKQRLLIVDGYEIMVRYSKADYGEYFLESLQIQSAIAPFIPFIVVCKLGRAFLGPHHLSYAEFFRSNKKVYCWALRSREGRPLLPDKKNKPGSYEGFEYSILPPGSVDLF